MSETQPSVDTQTSVGADIRAAAGAAVSSQAVVLSGRRVRARRVRLSSSARVDPTVDAAAAAASPPQAQETAAAPEAASEEAIPAIVFGVVAPTAADTPVAASPAALTPAVPAAAAVPIDREAWLSSATEFAAQEEALERAVRQKALFTKVLLWTLGVFVVGCSLTYLRFGDRLTRTELAIAGRTGSQAQAASIHTAAAVSTAPNAAVAADLTEYVNHDLSSVHADEAKAQAAYDSVTGNNFHGTGDVFAELNSSVLPNYTRFVEEAEAIHPRTAPVQAVHQLFLRSIHAKLLAYQHMREGQSDPHGMWQDGVKGEFVTSGLLANQFQARVIQMAREQSVKLF